MKASGSDDVIVSRWLAGWNSWDIAKATGIDESDIYARLHWLMPHIKRTRKERRGEAEARPDAQRGPAHLD
jgi:hypothetical protein